MSVHSDSMRASGSELEVRFTALFRSYHDLVWRSAWRFGASEANVDDLVQETFLVALRRLDEFELRERDARGAWLIAILRYVMHNHRRSGARRSRRHREFGELPLSRRVDEHEAEAHLAARLLGEFLERLPADRREVFVLAELGGYTSKEIGAALHLEPVTVRTRLHTARAEFRLAFEDEPRARIRAVLGKRCPAPTAGQRRANLRAIVLASPGQLANVGASAGLSTWVGKLAVVAVASTAVGALVAGGRNITTRRATAADVESRPTVERRVVALTHDAEPPAIEVAEPIEVRVDRRAATPSTSSEDANDSKIEQLRELARIREDLVLGRPQAVLDALASRAAWTDESFTERAIALEIGALCALERVSEARARFDGWVAQHPQGSLGGRLEAPCW